MILDLRLWISIKEAEPESRRLFRQDNDMSLETILAEVAIEGESMIDPVMVDQSEAGAIDKAKVFVIVSNENRLGRLFNRLANTKNFDAALIERLYECDSGFVTDFEANQSARLGEDKI